MLRQGIYSMLAWGYPLKQTKGKSSWRHFLCSKNFRCLLLPCVDALFKTVSTNNKWELMTDVSSLFDLIRTRYDTGIYLRFLLSQEISRDEKKKVRHRSCCWFLQPFKLRISRQWEGIERGNRCDQPVKPSHRVFIWSLTLLMLTTCAHLARDLVTSCIKQWELHKMKWFVIQAKLNCFFSRHPAHNIRTCHLSIMHSVIHNRTRSRAPT